MDLDNVDSEEELGDEDMDLDLIIDTTNNS